LEKLKVKHDSEINEIRSKIIQQYNFKYTASKELVLMKEYEKKY